MKNINKNKNKKDSKLVKYTTKRNLRASKEPPAKISKKKRGQLQFVVQQHAASRLHYDFRLELDGVLKSWAVPKGPSLNPTEKRLAIMVEDHPFGYKDFEGFIEEGYGKGTVIIWDRGVYSVNGLSREESEELLRQGLKKGQFHIFLEGEKLKGEFALVKLHRAKEEWLLFKIKDQFVSTEEVTLKDRSVVSHQRLEDLGGPRTAKPVWEKTPKAKKKPQNIKPMLATLIDKAFDDEEWLFELKIDGFRAIAELAHNKVELYSRNLKSFNERFPLIVDDLKRMKLDAIFDGEIAAIDEEGIPRFQLLQNQQKEDDPPIFYYVFDILYLDGKDLTEIPLIERKEILKSTLKKATERVRYLDHIEARGKALLKEAQKVGAEGIIGKRKSSVYKKGARSSAWVKIKAYLRQEALICGFTEPRKSRKNFGALILGAYREGELVFIGHVGGGFSEDRLVEMKKLLLPDIQKQCPFKKRPKANMKATWVKPKHLCEVRFSEWTNEGIMRQPIFLALHDHKSAKEVVPEEPMKTNTVLKKAKKEDELDFITHPDKIYWPKEKITKGAVLGYYAAVAPFILPYLKDRPQSLKRFPDGIEGERFYQKNIKNAPAWLRTIPVEHKKKTVNYLLIQDRDSLLYAVNLGCIEMHPWFSRYQNLDHPDFMVFDLDPEAISFVSVVETALALREVLEAIGISSFCKTTGSRGLHIYVPLQGKYTYEQAKQFAVIIASYVHEMLPDITSMERLPKKRQKKVYIDCFQNNSGQTLVAPYSLRARPGAPVATPLDWSEVKPGLDPLDFNLFNILQRLKKKGDLFKPILRKGIDMQKALNKFEREILNH